MTTRNVPIVAQNAVVCIIDVQNYCCHPHGGGAPTAAEEYFWNAVERTALPNLQILIKTCRETGVEVIYTVIESLTKDGRDRSVDYKISGFNVPKGSWDAKVVDAIAPLEDEIVLPKTSSSVFISTNLGYLLRQMGKTQVILCGGLTDQCVDSAVRDACDLGFLVTVPTDACYTYSQQRHDSALSNNAGYCRQLPTKLLVEEIGGVCDPSGRTPPSVQVHQQVDAAVGEQEQATVPVGRVHSRRRPTVPLVEGVSLRDYPVAYYVPDLHGLGRGKIYTSDVIESPPALYYGIAGMHLTDFVLRRDEIVAGGMGDCTAIPAEDRDSFESPMSAYAGRSIRGVICDLREKDTLAPLKAAPRYVCTNLCQVLRTEFHLEIAGACEFEFTLLRADRLPNRPHKADGKHDPCRFCLHSAVARSLDWFLPVSDALRRAGVCVDTLQTEYGPEQYEITYRYSHGVAAADNGFLIKQFFAEMLQGAVTFMSNPHAAGIGNSCHFNNSLWRKVDGRMVDAMWSDSDPDNMSDVARWWLAGILHHADAICAFACPTANCYRRLHRPFTPHTASWSIEKREDESGGVMVRVKRDVANKALYFENRLGGAAANPYLIQGATMAAGLCGLRKKMTMCPPGSSNGPELPRTLGDAIEALRKDSDMLAVLPGQMVDWYVDLKAQELEHLQSQGGDLSAELQLYGCL